MGKFDWSWMFASLVAWTLKYRYVLRSKLFDHLISLSSERYLFNLHFKNEAISSSLKRLEINTITKRGSRFGTKAYKIRIRRDATGRDAKSYKFFSAS